MTKQPDFPTAYQNFIFLRTYARWVESENRRETWGEAVKRYVDFMKENLGDKITEQEYSEIQQAILEHKVMPSMRLLWAAGSAARKTNATGYNCSFLAPTKIEDFGEVLYLLTCGCGVGFSVERHVVEKLPIVSAQNGEMLPVHVVEDSREGWAKALIAGMKAWYSGVDIEFDFSLVRPAGARLHTMGGRASGPAPLKGLLEFTREKILSRQNDKLRPIDVHDILCKIGDIVVMGGVRRSSEISLSDIDDSDMRNAKMGAFYIQEPQRTMANNSVAYKSKPTQQEFMEEWISLMKSGSGERGIFNRSGLEEQMPMRRWQITGEHYHTMGVNPCFDGDTIIETIRGPKKIKDITEPTRVYTMDDDGTLTTELASASWKTRENAKTLKVTFTSGKELIVTPEHQIYVPDKGWTMAKDLVKYDKVVHLQRQRRGAAYAGIKLTSEDKNCFRMEHRFVYEETHGKIQDGYDVNHIDRNTYNNSIDNLEVLSHSDHATLTRNQVPNNHQVQGEDGRFISGPWSNRGEKRIIHLPEFLRSNLHQYARVLKVEEGPVVDVYDISVNRTHNVIANFVVAHNCGEIMLRSKQFCNLSEVVARVDDTLETLKEKIRLATIIGTYQSSLTYLPYLSNDWKENCEEERLLGVSITGQYDCPEVRKPRTLKKLRDYAVEINRDYAKRIGINPASAITCTKPSGTVSQLVDTSSGAHPRYAEYYIRRVRVSSTDPILKMLIDQGVPYNKDNDMTYVLEFPMKSPDGAITKDNVTALDQLAHWKVLKENFTEHNPSITVYVGEDEWIAVANWLWENWDVVGGLSFLPKDNHVYKLAPYEPVSKEKYQELVSSFPEIDFSQLVNYETDDQTQGSKELACVSGVCDIDIPAEELTKLQQLISKPVEV